MQVFIPCFACLLPCLVLIVKQLGNIYELPAAALLSVSVLLVKISHSWQDL